MILENEGSAFFRNVANQQHYYQRNNLEDLKIPISVVEISNIAFRTQFLVKECFLIFQIPFGFEYIQLQSAYQ
jgi:hypothetical protein